MTDLELERACAIVAHKDAQPLRRALFAQLASRSPAVRAAIATWERLGSRRRRAAFVSALALARFLEVRFPAHDPDILGVWKYQNERRQLAALQALAPEARFASIALRPSVEATMVRTPRALFAEAVRAVRAYAGQDDFLVAARVAETVGYYARMLPRLAQSSAPAVLVSSDTNPYAVALLHAARRLGKRTCFVTHGHVAEGPPALDFDLTLLDGPAVREVYERAGPVRGTVVFKGAEGIARPMDAGRLAGGVRTLGIVLSILVDWRRVGARLDRLRSELSPERIVLRLHPNRAMRDPRWADHLDLERVHVSRGERPLVEDVDGCDLVAAGNTSAHLSVLKAGVPSVYVPGLDEMGDDYYGFVRDGILATAEHAIDPAMIERFYRDPEWPARFARFDAGYPDRQPACDRSVREGLRALVRGPREAHAAAVESFS